VQDSAAELVTEVIACLSRAEIPVYTVDITPPEIADLGLSVIRVLSDRIQPLEGDARLLRGVESRVRNAFSKTEFAPPPDRRYGNPAPHPLP
jgi:hypothetical protein